MATALSSWKEIARYLGKSVRTVQRWELELALPIRRLPHHEHAIFALPDELDAWMRSRTRNSGGPVAQSLRREMGVLRAENAALRARIDSFAVLVSSLRDGKRYRGNSHSGQKQQLHLPAHVHPDRAQKLLRQIRELESQLLKLIEDTPEVT